MLRAQKGVSHIGYCHLAVQMRSLYSRYGSWCCAVQDLVRVDAQHRVLLTGTPLQNSLEELFYLMNFLEPDKFSDVEEFKAAYATLDDKDKVGI